MRGEKSYTHSSSRKNSGSSPLARGKGIFLRPACHYRRIIPACAGKRIFWALLREAFQDHPRLRGEKVRSLNALVPTAGSSPLARGKAEQAPWPEAQPGIIPACAGKSPVASSTYSSRTDHPRLRGEKRHPLARHASVSGSSPLARGKVEIQPANLPAYRIIPACAGKRPALLTVHSIAEDHPRLRGEKFHLYSVVSDMPGSSPLARGKGRLVRDHALHNGIIPACAGKRSEAGT